MKTITAKIADLNATETAICNAIYTAEGAAQAAKIRKLAEKANIGFTDALLAKLLTDVKFGAIRVDGSWYAVVSGERQSSGYTHSSGALAEARHQAGAYGVAVEY